VGRYFQAVTSVFINYRRADASAHARLVYEGLQREPGLDVFMDVDNIGPGADFVDAIESAIDRCDITLAVIGREWADERDRQGRRRLDQATDYVRVELETALRRGVVVIPVLVGDAEMPGPDELPPTLAPLSRRNAIRLRDDSGWRDDIDRLRAALVRIGRTLERDDTGDSAGEADRIVAVASRHVPVTAQMPSPPVPSAPARWPLRSRPVLAIGVAAAVVLIIVAGVLVGRATGGGGASPAASPPSTASAGTSDPGGGASARAPGVTTAGAAAAGAVATTGDQPGSVFSTAVVADPLTPASQAFDDHGYGGGDCAFRRRLSGFEVSARNVALCFTTDGPSAVTRTAGAVTVTAQVLRAADGLDPYNYDVAVGCYSSGATDYLLTLGSTGNYLLFRRPDGADATTLAAGHVDGVDLVHGPHRLRLECGPVTSDGLRLAVYVDRRRYAEVLDPDPLTAGRFYFGVSHTIKDRPVTVRFTDYLLETAPA
jgi:hypothetical protein